MSSKYKFIFFLQFIRYLFIIVLFQIDLKITARRMYNFMSVEEDPFEFDIVTNTVLDVKSVCSRRDPYMSLHVSFTEKFTGFFYIDRHIDWRDCQLVGDNTSTSLTFKIPLFGCGTKFFQGLFYNIVVLKMEGSLPIIEVWDRAYLVICDYQALMNISRTVTKTPKTSHTRTLVGGIRSGGILKVQLIQNNRRSRFDRLQSSQRKSQYSNRRIIIQRPQYTTTTIPFNQPIIPKCQMKIVEGSDFTKQSTHELLAGKNATLVIALPQHKNEPMLDIRVRSCTAEDLTKRFKMTLFDENKCSKSDKILSPIHKETINGSVISYFHFNSFRFKKNSSVIFGCNVEICPGTCYKKSEAKGKRFKREIKIRVQNKSKSAHFRSLRGQTNPSEDMSYLFLQKEIPVRLSNMMREINYLPENLLKMPSIQIVQNCFADVLQFENINPSSPKIKQDFVETLIRIRNRHMNVVETVAQGLNEMKDMYGEVSKSDGNIQYFLDRFFLSRISIRMLITQHTMMFGGIIPDHPRNVGCIDPHCNVQAVLEDAFENARFICDNYYMGSPNVDITSHNAKTPEAPINVVYVPSHLYHILFEIFKNALRATIEYHGRDRESYPTVKALIVKGLEDLTIRISDQGGGVPLSKYGNLFQYTYSTAPRPSVKDPSTSPMAGFGFGLPLSRLYARYFQGDLKLISLEGYGMDAILYIKALPNAASELLPVFNKAVTKIYTSSTPIGEYSGTPNVNNLGDNIPFNPKTSTPPTSPNVSPPSSSLTEDTYFTNPDIQPKAYEPPLSYEYYLYLLKKKYGENIPQRLLDNLDHLESVAAFNVAEFENSLNVDKDFGKKVTKSVAPSAAMCTKHKADYSTTAYPKNISKDIDTTYNNKNNNK